MLDVLFVLFTVTAALAALAMGLAARLVLAYTPSAGSERGRTGGAPDERHER